jgi:hypothetical protein
MVNILSGESEDGWATEEFGFVILTKANGRR